MDPTLFCDPEARLPHTPAVRLWQSVGRLTNDRIWAFALRARSGQVNLEPWIMRYGQVRISARLSVPFPPIIGSSMTPQCYLK